MGSGRPRSRALTPVRPRPWRAAPLTGDGTSPEPVRVGGSCGERVGASPHHRCYLTSAGCGALGQTQSKDQVGSVLTIPRAPFSGGHGARHESAVQHVALGVHPRGLRSEAGQTRGPECPTAAAMTTPAQEEPAGSAPHFGCAVGDTAAPLLHTGGARGPAGGRRPTRGSASPAALGASPPGQAGAPCLPGKLQMVNHHRTQAKRLPGSRI